MKTKGKRSGLIVRHPNVLPSRRSTVASSASVCSMRVAPLGVERVVGFFVGPVVGGISASSSWDLSKGAPNRLAYQLEVVSNLHQVRIVANQEAAVVL